MRQAFRQRGNNFRLRRAELCSSLPDKINIHSRVWRVETAQAFSIER